MKLTKSNIEYMATAGIYVVPPNVISGFGMYITRLGSNNGVYGYNWDAYELITSDNRRIIILEGNRNFPSSAHYIGYDIADIYCNEWENFKKQDGFWDTHVSKRREDNAQLYLHRMIKHFNEINGI